MGLEVERLVSEVLLVILVCTSKVLKLIKEHLNFVTIQSHKLGYWPSYHWLRSLFASRHMWGGSSVQFLCTVRAKEMLGFPFHFDVLVNGIKWP